MAWRADRGGNDEDLSGILHCWTRRNILVSLLGPRRDAGCLASLLGVSTSLFSKQAHELERCGLLAGEREGAHVYWSLRPTARIVADTKGVEFILHGEDGCRAQHFIPFDSIWFRLLKPGAEAAGIKPARSGA